MNKGRQEHSDDIAYPSGIAFLLLHLACFAAIWTGVTPRAVVLGVALYVVRIFAIGAGYHRYFAHRAFRTSRVFQFCWHSWRRPRPSAAFCGGPPTTAGTTNTRTPSSTCTRRCSAASSMPMSAGSSCRGTMRPTMRRCATWRATRSWCGSIGSPTCPRSLLAVATWLIAGWPGLVVGFCWSTVVLWHATFSINSLAHVVGRRRYVTGDESRNNWLLALLTMGEGWHNNHHAYQVSVRQGFRWWEFDPTYYALRVLSWLGIVWDLHVPPKAVVRGEHRLGQLVIDKVACAACRVVPGQSHRQPGAGGAGAGAGLDRPQVAAAVGTHAGGGVLERNRPAAGPDAR